MKSFTIENKIVGEDASCFVIAEAGSNHDRSLNQAFKLIEVATEAGADAVKFQLFSAEMLAAKTKENIASLQKDKFGTYGKTLYDLYKKLELPREWLVKLKKYAKECGIIFSATPFDEDAVDELEHIKVPFYKIASFELVHLPLIRYVASKRKPIILSTGMANMEEIEDAVNTIREAGNDQYALLHCGIEYPPRVEDIHLAAMDTISEKFQCPVGYSDHTTGNTVPIGAVARGAKIIEKHFTIDKNLKGPDHKYALSPVELREMVLAIRDVEKAIGLPQKKAVERELVYLKRGRRSLFAKRDIKKGDRITKEMISILRPATGLLPKYLDEVARKRARIDIYRNEPITWEKLENGKG